MNTLLTTDTARRPRPRLRLLREEHHDTRPQECHDTRAHQRTHAPSRDSAQSAGYGQVLVAGCDPAARSEMLTQLSELLPEGTAFVEASQTWEVVAQASQSRMVVLTSDLRDLSARGLVRVLSRRHPLLPVIALGRCTEDDSGAARAPAGAPSLGAVSL